MDNIRTLSENIKFICTSFRNSEKASGDLFWRVSQRVPINFIISDNILTLCLSCNVKKPKQLPNCLKRAETNVVLIVFDGDLVEVRVYTATVFYRHIT